MSHVVFDLFTFPEHKILYNRDKFPYDITVGITFQADKKIPVNFLEIISNREINKSIISKQFETILIL